MSIVKAIVLIFGLLVFLEILFLITHNGIGKVNLSGSEHIDLDDLHTEYRKNCIHQNPTPPQTTDRNKNPSSLRYAEPPKPTQTMSENKDADILREQQNRQMALRKYCQGVKLSQGVTRNGMGVKRSNHMIYSDKARLLYCFVPKAACTTWKRMFLMFEDQNMTESDVMKINKNRVHNLPFSWYNRVSAETKATMESRYYSFLISRHPFERLVAAFRNKIQDPDGNAYRKKYGSQILRTFRKGQSEQFYAKGKDVKFIEFVRFIIQNKTFDEHWEPIVTLCTPCAFKYDYLAKMNTLIPDSNAILKETLLGKEYRFLANATDRYKKKSNDLVKSYFKDIPLKTIFELYEVYRADFTAFGYTISDMLDI